MHVDDVTEGTGTPKLVPPQEDAAADDEVPAAFAPDLLERELVDEDAPEPQPFTFSV